jgi:hypothetical protein
MKASSSAITRIESNVESNIFKWHCSPKQLFDAKVPIWACNLSFIGIKNATAHINLSCEAVDISVAPKGASEGSMFPCGLIQINL